MNSEDYRVTVMQDEICELEERVASLITENTNLNDRIRELEEIVANLGDENWQLQCDLRSSDTMYDTRPSLGFRT